MMSLGVQQNQQLARRLNRLAWALTAAVLALVVLMRYVKIPLPNHWNLGFLPPFHATLNAITALVLLYAFYQIKRKRVKAHRQAIYLAMGLSALFLLSYVAYHFTSPGAIFGDINHDGVLSADEKAAAAGIRPLYLTILASHIVLAALILPFILFTFIRAYTNQIERHRRMARWVFPVWLYVAVTGPVCYVMMLPYYP
jgi:putative membrane protein